jgi:hypothetical protein
MLIIEDLTVIVKGMNYAHYWRPDCDCEGYELCSLLKTWLWLWRVWTMLIIEDLTVFTITVRSSIMSIVHTFHNHSQVFNNEHSSYPSLLKTWLWLWRVWTMLIIEDLTVIVKGMNYAHHWRPDCDCEGYELCSSLKTNHSQVFNNEHSSYPSQSQSGLQ